MHFRTIFRGPMRSRDSRSKKGMRAICSSLMKIEEITLREIHIRLRNPFETSFGITWERRILLVEVRCDGVTGWGEVTAGEGPFYNSETTDTAWAIFRKFVAPLTLGKSISAAAGVLELL